ncbi:MAG: SUMF1/EgtB/PvdO family nonheme iron enzyme [Pseudomonadota bacterium]
MYLLALIVDQEYRRWASLFVPLAGKMDIPQVIEGIPVSFTELCFPGCQGGMQSQPTRLPLENIADAMQKHDAFVILGEPGSGKTTTLQKIAYDAARTILDGGFSRVPLFVRLSQQKERDPYTFLQAEWERRSGDPFENARRDGRILILADGVNEIPREKRSDCLIAWMLFAQDWRGGNQLIFSGREMDYDNQLSLPRVLVQPLDDERISGFLHRHQADDLQILLNDPQNRLREMASNPLHLFVLTMVYLQVRKKELHKLANRGWLFHEFSWYLMAWEQKWHPDDLDVKCKEELFSVLAYEMQKQGSGTTFERKAAMRVLPATVYVKDEDLPLDPLALFRFGRGATILDPTNQKDVRFYHHMLQEYFAARELLRRFKGGEDLSELWCVNCSVDEMLPAKVGEWDPLPEPPSTGWEVTTILACGLCNSPETLETHDILKIDVQTLLEALRRVNPTLAGRCLDESGIDMQSDDSMIDNPFEKIKNAVRADLLSSLYNPQVHLRARLQAGYILGKIGDPRFEKQVINGVQVILPQMVSVAAGEYVIGSAKDDKDAYPDEKPQKSVGLKLFSIAKWPLTNAEFDCFIQAGGYQDEQYWQGDFAKHWLRGEDVAGGQFSALMDWWRQSKDMDDVRKTLEQTGNFTPEQVDSYEYIAGLSETELKEQLSRQLSKKSRLQPAYWNDQQFNNPSQPVVGITWFEARAYCVWLSQVIKREFRLPSEAEWEAAARGVTKGIGDRWAYPWGSDWGDVKANTIEGRVLKPSPVGAYTCVGAIGPFKAEDQAGNVWNWTNSLYLPYPYDPAKSELEDVDGERVVRGGSWGGSRRRARCALRSRFVPVGFDGSIGFRVVSPGIFPVSDS